MRTIQLEMGITTQTYAPIERDVYVGLIYILHYVIFPAGIVAHFWSIPRFGAGHICKSSFGFWRRRRSR